MYKCLSTNDLPNTANWADTLGQAAALQCSGLELCLAGQPLGEFAAMERSSSRWQEILDAVGGAGLTLAALTSASFDLFGLAQADEGVRERAVERCRWLVDMAGCCAEAPTVIVGVRALHGSEQPLGQPYEQAFNSLFGSLITLAEYAADRAVTLGFENPAQGLLLSPLEVRDLIDQINNPYVGLCLNPHNAQRLYDPLDLIELLGRQIVAVHLPARAGGGDDAASESVAMTGRLKKLGVEGPLIYRVCEAGA